MERVLDLKTPPVVGETYLVPVVDGTNGQGKVFTVPVIGQVHNDKDIGAADMDHIHVDRRFASADELERAGWPRDNLDNTNAVPVVGFMTEWEIREEPRVCVSQDFPQARSFKAGSDHLLAYEVRKLRGKGVTHLNMACKVCPHKGTRLDNVKPQCGVIICPAHGMEFDAYTGEILQF